MVEPCAGNSCEGFGVRGDDKYSDDLAGQGDSESKA